MSTITTTTTTTMTVMTTTMMMIKLNSQRWSVSSTQLALPRCTATDSCWRRNMVERGSCVTAGMRRPRFCIRPSACSPQTPDVSTATGTKSTPEIMSAYLATFRDSAAAAEPACTLLARRWDAAYVSGQVASHAKHRPLDQGTIVTPSGRLPLLVHSGCGSRVADVPALMNARLSKSLSWLGRECISDTSINSDNILSQIRHLLTLCSFINFIYLQVSCTFS